MGPSQKPASASRGDLADDDGGVLAYIHQNVSNVLDMGLEADFGVSKVGALAQSSERGGIDVVSPRAQQRDHLFPAPASEPGWVHEDKRCHRAPIQSRSTWKAAALPPICARLA